jgi:hypothetical protein
MSLNPAAAPDPSDDGREPSDDGRSDDGPFGLPVLAEVPELAGLLELAVDAERLTARLVEAIIVLEDHDVAATATGVPLEQWLAAVGRSTRSDRRMLQTAARVCRRLPSLRTAFAGGRVSWSQVRAVGLKVDRLPRHLDDRLDAALADAIEGAAGADPDALARVVGWAVADLAAADDPPPKGAPDQDVLVLQPRLDGTGGTFFGDFGPVGFAALEAATDPGPTGAATREHFGDVPDGDRAAERRQRAGHARAARLIDLCRRRDGDVASPTLLVRAELSSLLGRDGLPAQLLTHLAGGVMHVDVATARRLADDHGADLRLVVLDDGKVVGVGRKVYRPPGWLAEATLALHDTCTEPGCQVAARVCDADHAVPFAGGGRTDVDNVAPLCGTANAAKEPGGWRAAQTSDGARTWHHPRTGLRVRTLPAMWRPPPSPDHRRPPAGGRPRAHSVLEGHLHQALARGQRSNGSDRDDGSDSLPF